MIRSEIIATCDECGDETINLSHRLEVSPEWYTIGFSEHMLAEEDWSIDVSTGECKCPNCK